MSADHLIKPSQAHAFARSDRSALGVWWWTIDRWLLGAAAVLIGLGILLSFAASPAAAARMNVGDPFHFALRQCVFAVVGASVLIGASMLEVRMVRRLSFFIFVGAIALMIALPFMGHTAKGATRWVEFAGFTLQPSEFLKPA
ncbi:MAG: FtsW/RodA/SpoVE family cell cycle protein, partial [Phenylobacterium sp.]|nr:FtsW/RodA/SpoVE family cell cycle protein [Phenylobacterium sp.]